MLKLPKGLKKKKKGKKSKRKGEDELFTEAELEKYRQEHQQPAESGEGSVKQNEEWSKFKDLTSGIDSVLKKTQGDLDRIKTTSFFQRIPDQVKEVDSVGKERAPTRAASPPKSIVEVTEADFPKLAAAHDADGDRSECGVTDDESDDDEQDDIFDTSYVDAVERGECKLAYVPDSPDQPDDDDIFDTSHVDAIIKGKEAKSTAGGAKKVLDIGVAVEVLTGRIDNVTLPTTKRPKRYIPGDFLLENSEETPLVLAAKLVKSESVEKSILDVDEDIPITSPIDLSVSLHTAFKKTSEAELTQIEENSVKNIVFDEEDDEFTQLAAESLEAGSEVTKLEDKEIKVEAVVDNSWSVFEADKNEIVFAQGVVEDQIDVIDPYFEGDDPFDTSFADAVVPALPSALVNKQPVILDEDDDFDPRAEEFQGRLNNRRKSSVRIHITDPSGIRESITSDDNIIANEENKVTRDLLGGSTTDLSQLGDLPLNPLDLADDPEDIDPFDTTIVDKIVAPGRVELKFLEKELIGASEPVSVPIYRVDSDPDFDPRAEEPEPARVERRASRPENLVVSKSVIFNVDEDGEVDTDLKNKQPKPVTPYYTKELSITESIPEDEGEAADTVSSLTRTRSDEELAPKFTYQAKRRHSEFTQLKQSKAPSRASVLLETTHHNTKVLTPCGPTKVAEEPETDPFDTSFTGNIVPSKTELKLLAKEFSCEDTNQDPLDTSAILLETSDDIFQVKALSPEPTSVSRAPAEDFDPFDTSFASDLQPGRTEIKLLESEFLN